MLIGAWIACMILGAAILSGYNKAGTGFLFGLVLGPLGVVLAITTLLSERKKLDEQRHKQQTELLAKLQPGGSQTNARGVISSERECPHCAETILIKAKVCKHCGRDVDPISLSDIPTGWP